MTLSRDDLFTLEQYHAERPAFKDKVLKHKIHRQVPLGPNATLYFEDRTTIQYQIQEMLRVERIFEAEAIQEELDAYNPLIPDGDNWKATFMLEYDDVDERRVALEKLVGIEDQTWMQVEGHARVYAIADEDLERSKETKTSAVHFMRFQLDPEMVASARQGATISAGISHPEMTIETGALPSETTQSLVADLHE
ncbi:MAG: DUF3501 family protein [Gammaproteobacteria bacterium]